MDENATTRIQGVGLGSCLLFCLAAFVCAAFVFPFVYGTLPFQGGPDARLGGYVRFKDTVGASPAELQLMLLDAWPCPSILRLSAPAFASTVTWTAHLLGNSAPGFHRFRYETLAGNDGFSTTLGHMWDSEGKHVAVTEQTAVIFD